MSDPVFHSKGVQARGPPWSLAWPDPLDPGSRQRPRSSEPRAWIL